jgi:glycine/D-amino acid oxidase-like deaminating enzyme
MVSGGGPEHIAVIGGGLAGALLAWRLRKRGGRRTTDLYVGDQARPADATEASGGLIRGFETDPVGCASAAASLAELLGDG